MAWMFSKKGVISIARDAANEDKLMEIVLESGAGQLGQWRHHERQIAADFRKAFGEEPGRLISVGLMTDSDNTQSLAEAWYGEVRLVAPDGRLF